MDTQEVIAALQRKRDELFARLAELNQERDTLVTDLAHLHGTLRAFDGRLDYPTDVNEIISAATGHKPRPTFKLKRGELGTLIGQILRSSDTPMTSNGIAASIADTKGIPAEDEASRKALVNQVSIALNALLRRKVVTSERTPGRRSHQWRLAAP